MARFVTLLFVMTLGGCYVPRPCHVTQLVIIEDEKNTLVIVRCRRVFWEETKKDDPFGQTP